MGGWSWDSTRWLSPAALKEKSGGSLEEETIHRGQNLSARDRTSREDTEDDDSRWGKKEKEDYPPLFVVCGGQPTGKAKLAAVFLVSSRSFLRVSCAATSTKVPASACTRAERFRREFNPGNQRRLAALVPRRCWLLSLDPTR